MTAPVWVRFSSTAASMARPMPQSATFTDPVGVMRMFPGLMSRCSIPALWA